MIKLHQVDKFYGRHDVLKAADLFVGPGEKVGLVGPNGAGKTTIFRIILGDLSPDGGEVFCQKNLRVGHLPQDLLSFSGQTVLGLVLEAADEVRRVEAELKAVEKRLVEVEDQAELESLVERQGHLLSVYDHLGGYDLTNRAQKLLEGLGFHGHDFDRPVEQLSGGWIMRTVLARLLLSEPDLLLLDEPSNHLDLESLLWLERTLQTAEFAVLLTSHDRVFLNNVANRIVEVDGGRLYSYTGGYDEYERQRDERLRSLESQYQTQQEKIKQIQRFVDRNRTRKDRAAQVQGRLKALDKMEKIEPPRQDKREISLDFGAVERGPKLVVDLEDVSVDYGLGPVYDGLTFKVNRGDRMALLGNNGQGKSTLMRLLAGRQSPDHGRPAIGTGVKTGYFSQLLLDDLHPEMTVVEELATVAGDLSPGRLRNILGGFLFTGDEVLKKVSVLSGGEKSRLLLCKLMITGPNLLLLDEPTNHLDIPARRMLERALTAYQGTLVLVTHDRRLINAVANQIVEVGGGGVRVYPGDFDDYEGIWKKRDVEVTYARGVKGDRASTTPVDEPDRDDFSVKPKAVHKTKTQKRAEAELRQQMSQQTAPLKKRISGLEAGIDRAGAEIERIDVQLALPDNYQDPFKAAELNRQRTELTQKIEAMTGEWERAAIDLEGLELRMRLEGGDAS